MIRINLLPPDIQVSERKLNPAYIVGGVAVFLIVFLFPISWTQYTKRSHLLVELTSLQSELERYKPIVAQVEALEAAKAQLQQRKTIIQQLENDRLRYPYFMEDFLKLLPNNVWLTNLSTSLSGDNASMAISMEVVALDHYAVADMVSNLETSQIFTDVELGSINLSQASSGGQTISFHITTTYRKAMLNTNAPKRS